MSHMAGANMHDRLEALRDAAEVMRTSGIEYGTEDLLIAADWLATGTHETALELGEMHCRNYLAAQTHEVSRDAARWIPKSTEA